MQASFTYVFTNKYQTDASMHARLAGIDVGSCIQERIESGDVDSLCSDITTTVGVGIIQRVVILNLSASFTTKFPQESQQYSAMRKMFLSRLEMMMPGSLTETLVIANGLCP